MIRTSDLQPTFAPHPSPKQPAVPHCLVQEDAREYQILFYLGTHPDHQLRLLLSQDGKRLHVLAEPREPNGEEPFLWSFRLPKRVDTRGLEIESRGVLHLVHLPKNSWLRKVDGLLARTGSVRAQMA